MRAVALLSAWKIRNAFRTTFSDPRKLGPLLFFTICVTITLALFGVGISQAPSGSQDGKTIDPVVLRAGTTFCMILLGLAVIDGGLGDSLLAFPLPDVDYLFPSPISRKIVLAYKLPALTFGAVFFGGFVLVLFSTLTRFAQPGGAHVGNISPPSWVAPLSLVSSVGIYFNLAMWVSVRIRNRGKIHLGLIGAFLTFGACLGVLWWLRGSNAVVAVLESDWIRTIFKPSSLASDVLVAGFCHRPAMDLVEWLLIGYVLSLVPMFLSNANWYEQSIVSSERISMIRQAARGGFSSLMAAKSANFKHKAARTYTVPPFGQGAFALFWAHLCAATKRPFTNFVAPLLGGLALGSLGGVANINNSEIVGLGFLLLAGLASYSTMAFMQIARTASEGAIRRRELLSPLPKKGWQSVAANLAVPVMAFDLFCFGCALSYGSLRAPDARLVVFGFLVFMPLRTAARMTLQYVIVLGYPDLADKMQQVLSVGVYMILTTPFLFAEVVFCIPALYFQSMWLGFVTLSLLQIPFIVFLLFIAGKAAEKAVATGEPINLFQLFRSRA